MLNLVYACSSNIDFPSFFKNSLISFLCNKIYIEITIVTKMLNTAPNTPITVFIYPKILSVLKYAPISNDCTLLIASSIFTFFNIEFSFVFDT